MKKIYIDGETITSCGLCVHRRKNHNQDLYCYLTGSFWDPVRNDTLINPDCPFLNKAKKKEIL